MCKTRKRQKISFKKCFFSYIQSGEFPAHMLESRTDQKHHISLVYNGSNENNYKHQLRKYNLLVLV